MVLYMTSNTTMKFINQEPLTVKKKELVSQLKKLPKNTEVSWLITDKRSYGWSEINQQKQKFIKELSSTNFKAACVGTFNTKTKKTKYSSYKVKAH